MFTIREMEHSKACISQCRPQRAQLIWETKNRVNRNMYDVRASWYEELALSFLKPYQRGWRMRDIRGLSRLKPFFGKKAKQTSHSKDDRNASSHEHWLPWTATYRRKVTGCHWSGLRLPRGENNDDDNCCYSNSKIKPVFCHPWLYP